MDYQSTSVNGAVNGASDDKRPTGPTINGTGSGAPDRNPARDLLQLYHDAARSCDGILMLGTVNPSEERPDPKKPGKVKPAPYRPKRFKIGDAAGMALEAVAIGDAANVYFAPAVIRKDIKRGRGRAEDITAQLGLVIDDDRDTGKLATLPAIDATAIVETCREPTVNQHVHFVFTRPLPATEADELAKLLFRKCGGDSGTKDVAHVWRVPGTLNHPTATKIKRGRPAEPQPVRLIGGTMQPVDPDALRLALESMPDIAPAAPKPKKASKPATSVDAPQAGADAAELIKALPKKLREAIRTEDTGDRSAYSFKIMCQLFERGLSEADVGRIARDPTSLFASKYQDRSDLDQEVSRVFATWTAAKAKRQADADENLDRMNEQYAVVKLSGKR